MFRLESKINTKGVEFLRNRDEYLSILGKFKETLLKVRQGGPPQSVARHKEREKLLARERIDLLVDKNTPFIELSTLAAYDLYNNEFPSAGIVTGIGVIHGKETIIIANDATVKGDVIFKAGTGDVVMVGNSSIGGKINGATVQKR